MRVYGNKTELDIARVDTDIIAFMVEPEEVDDIVEYLVSAIIARCVYEFGASPKIL